MPRQIVPYTDKIFQEDFSKAFLQSPLRKSIKISKKAIIKQIARLPLFVLKRSISNEQLLSYSNILILFYRENVNENLSFKGSVCGATCC